MSAGRRADSGTPREGSPRRSVVIPTHDTRELTLACLRSVLGGDEHAVEEIVLVDDASRDGTADAVREQFPAITLLVLDTNRGFTHAVNEGASRARGDHLVLLNSDTRVAPDALRRLSLTLDEHPELGAVGAQLFDPSGELQWSAGRDPSALWLFVMASGIARHYARIPGLRRLRPAGGRHRAGPAPTLVDWVPATAMAVRREAWLALGGFDPAYALYAQDLDFCVRLRRAGFRVALEPRARVTHHLGATIGASPDASADRVRLAALWLDLVRWAERSGGPTRARRARLALEQGGRLRRLLDALLTPRAKRADVDTARDRRVLAAALAALEREPRTEPIGERVSAEPTE